MLYIQNRAGETLAVIGKYYKDTRRSILENGASTYQFTISKNEPDEEFVVRGNYVIMLDSQGRGHQYTIIRTEENHDEKEVYCEDASLELLNKERRAWAKPDTAQPISYYANKALADTGWQIGLNEIPSSKRTLEWTGRDTAFKRLLSIANVFDVELDFYVDFNMANVVRRVVDIKKTVGSIRDDIQLVYGESVTDIKKTESIESMVTALEGIGSVVDGIPEGQPEEHYNFSEIAYDDGDYFSPKGDPLVYARTANQEFNIRKGYIERGFEYDIKNPQELLNRAISELKKVSQPMVNYEVSLVKYGITNLHKGDTIKIIDSKFSKKAQLLLQARVLEISETETGTGDSKAIFGNFLTLQSNLSKEIMDLQQQLRQLPKARTPHPWVRYADDDKGTGMSMFPVGKAYMATVWSYETAVPSDNPIDYAGKWIKVKGEDGQDGSNGVAGPKGADGQTSYFHTAWADDISGTTGFTTSGGNGKKYIGTYSDLIKADSEDPSKYKWALFKGADGQDGQPGKDGTGIKTTVVRYQASSSGTTQPTGIWSSTVPAVTKGQYLWTRTDWAYTDGTAETGYSVSYIAKDGNNGTDGIAGKDGVGIKSTAITYQSGASGTVQPTGTWAANPPSVPGGQYLWTRTVWSYTDGTSETGYSVAKAGEKGDKGDKGLQGDNGKDGVAGKDGVGIKSTSVTYQASASGTTAPTGAWVSSPTAVAGQYQWTRTVWTYTDGTTEVGYSVGHIGANGATGKDGLAGKDGVGITSTLIEYVGAISGTSKPTSGWSTTIPSVPAGQYLWTRTTWQYTDGTSEQGFTNALMGRTGAAGKDGVDGKDGEPGSKDVPVTTVSASQPTTAKNGDIWWVLNSTDVATAMKVYTSGAWVDKKVDQSVLNIVTLNAVTINGSTINGSEFNISYTGTLSDGRQGSSQQTLDKNGYSQTSTFYEWDDSQIVTRSEISNYGGIVMGYTPQAKYNPSQPWANTLGSIYLDPINLYIGFTGADRSGIYNLSIQDAYQNSGSATYLNGWGSWNADYSLKVIRQGRMVTVWGYIKHNNSATITPFAQVPAWARPEQGLLISAVTFNSSVGNPIASALVMNAETGRIGFNSGGQKGGYVCFSTTYVGGDV